MNDDKLSLILNSHNPSCGCYNEISVKLSLCGKGGFGSMLRAAKLNNIQIDPQCDLSGRRHRFVEQEKELTEWLKE